jgi:simple sugar transport system ATP-binding protein
MSLILRDIHKHFGPVRANHGVTIEVPSGELHGLLGENGAGKSTLMKVLSGFISADSGEVVLDGTTLDLAAPDDAIAAGIGMLHQDPLVFLPFTVLDNFLAGSPGRLDRKAGAIELATTAEKYGFHFNPEALASTLTVGERQQLEIARLLWLGARVLILDEPTTGISALQREKLFEILRRLAAEGMIVIFVSHKLEEIDELCDRVTVMRTGRVIGEATLPVPSEQLVEMMFGEVVVERERPPVPLGAPALELRSASLEDRLIHVRDLSLQVHAGEVVGLAGMEGSGQRSLLRACAGLLPLTGGSIHLGGSDLTGKAYRQFLNTGMHLLPAGRLEEGLVAGLTVTEHFELVSDHREFLVDWNEAARIAGERVDHHSIRGTGESLAEGLSGGNQQRLLLAMMPPELTLLLMEHPTRGLDIESAEWVWSQLLRRREDGTAIIFASADLDELLRYSDRIVVFFAGDVFKILDATLTSGEELGYLIGGKELSA